MHQKILEFLANTQFRHLPVIDSKGRIVNVVYLNDLPQSLHKENWVVLMVGGKGSRLRPLTDDSPKPMLKVGNKPLLETILEIFAPISCAKYLASSLDCLLNLLSSVEKAK